MNPRKCNFSSCIFQIKKTGLQRKCGFLKCNIFSNVQCGLSLYCPLKVSDKCQVLTLVVGVRDRQTNRTWTMTCLADIVRKGLFIFLSHLLRDFALANSFQQSPVDLAVMTEILYICAIQYGSH